MRSTPGATATLVGEQRHRCRDADAADRGLLEPRTDARRRQRRPEAGRRGSRCRDPRGDAGQRRPARRRRSASRRARRWRRRTSPVSAALYLGEHPTATPGEIKSALMTTAYDTVNADGSANTDPFAQGAGHVDADEVPRPGSAVPERSARLGRLPAGARARRLRTHSIRSTASDLNLASIAIGSLAGRRRSPARSPRRGRAPTASPRASRASTSRSSPATLTFAGPGETQTFTVTFTNRTAPVEEWATGFLTWTAEDGTSVRSPIAVRPVTADAPAQVAGDGIDGQRRRDDHVGRDRRARAEPRRSRPGRAPRRPGQPGRRPLGRRELGRRERQRRRGSSTSRPDRRSRGSRSTRPTTATSTWPCTGSSARPTPGTRRDGGHRPPDRPTTQSRSGDPTAGTYLVVAHLRDERGADDLGRDGRRRSPAATGSLTQPAGLAAGVSGRGRAATRSRGRA